MHQVSTIGGASYCMLSLVNAIDRSKYQPVVLLRGDGPLAEEFRKRDVEVAFLQGMPTVPYNKSLLRLKTVSTYLRTEYKQKEFLNILQQLRIDIVYLNNMMLYPYLKTAKENGYKTIIHIREHWPKDEHQLQMERARKYVAIYADWIIAINKYSASLFPECAEKITIIYDWIDFSNRDEPRPFCQIFGSEAESLKVILFTGGMARIKGTLEIVRLFHEKINGSEYRLLMIGSGLDYRFEGISGIIKKFIMLFGWKPYGYRVTEIMKRDKRIVAIPATYSIADLFKQAYCTVSFFTIPHANLALAEAIELGTVAIAPLTEEALEYSDNGQGALLYEINNEEDLLEKFNYLEDNYDYIKERIKLHSDNVKTMFSTEDNSKKLHFVCDKVANMI